MKNKRTLIAIIIAVVVLLILVGNKLLTYYRYTIPKPDTALEVANGFKNYKTIKITKRSLPEKEYIKVDHFKMSNFLEGYELQENSSNNYISYKKKVDDLAYAVQFNTDNTNIEMTKAFVDHGTVIYGDEISSFLKGDLTEADREGFLKKNNINNDIDFYKFIGNNYFINSSIFSDLETLKQNYAFNLFVETAIPKIDGWIILEGDITGYIFNVGTKTNLPAYQICIMDNDKQYSFLTNDIRFSDEKFITELVSSIIIE